MSQIVSYCMYRGYLWQDHDGFQPAKVQSSEVRVILVCHFSPSPLFWQQRLQSRCWRCHANKMRAKTCMPTSVRMATHVIRLISTCFYQLCRMRVIRQSILMLSSPANKQFRHLTYRQSIVIVCWLNCQHISWIVFSPSTIFSPSSHA